MDSLWASQIHPAKLEPARHSSLDLAIIGGGLSALWSAFHAKRFDPTLRIGIFEAEKFGFGASGRSGGWVSSDFPVSKKKIIEKWGGGAAELLESSLSQSIDEIGGFATSYAPEADFTKSGSLIFTRNLGQVERLQSNLDRDHQWLEPYEVREKIRIAGQLGGVWNGNSARINPLGLVSALVKYLTKAGVDISENSFATSVPEGILVNNRYLEAGAVIEATEVFGRPGRDYIPLYSLMIASEPLRHNLWQEMGNLERFTFAEGRHLINYAQKSIDGRLVLGGRGATYPFASRLSDKKERDYRVHKNLQNLALQWFPQLAGHSFTHFWGGAVAITRDWQPYIQWDPSARRGRLGGYAGDGLTMSFLAAKVIAALMTENKIPESNLHFVNKDIRQWEIEPLRYLAVNSLVKLSALADREEALTSRASVLSRIIEPLILR